MHKLLLALSAAGMLIAAPVSAQTIYGDPYAPRVVVTPGATYEEPMTESQVYLAPETTYVLPGQQYTDQPIYMNGQRYYRDCWWDWGQRRCELKPWN